MAHLQQSASALDNADTNADLAADAGDASAAVDQEDISGLLQSWFREQRQFEQNVELRKQCGLLAWQLQQLKQHLSEKQHKQTQQWKLHRKH